MSWPPAVSDFKAQFTREFIYGDGGLDSVSGNDIQRALNEAASMFNQSLLNTAADQMIGYLYLAAHLMVLNIQGAGGLSAVPRGRGVRNVGEGVQVSKGIGQANVTYQVPPPHVADSPIFLFLFRTDFGQRYMAMIEPSLPGQFAVQCGPNPNQWNDE